MTEQAEDIMPITVNKTVNIWSVGVGLIGLFVAVFGWGVVYSSMVAADANNKAANESVANELKLIAAQLPEIKYDIRATANQATENKAAITEANKRMDRIVDSIGGKIDNLTETVNKLVTSVAVLTDAKPQRTRFQIKEIRP